MSQIDVADVRLVWFCRCFVDEEMVQIAAHQRFVVADWRQQRVAFEVSIQICRKATILFQRQEFRFDVSDLTWQADVHHEAVFVIDATSAIKHQPVIENVRLQRIVYRSQAGNELPQAVKVGIVLLRLVGPVHIVVGMQLAQIGIHEVRLIQQISLEPQAFIKLFQQQPSMNGH